VFLVDWPEPFGLAMIEAMACGTPVLALRRGSVEEVVEEGLTGHIVDGIGQATAIAARVKMLDRKAIRRRFEERFTAARMAKDYLRVYHSNVKLIPDQGAPLQATAAELANEPSESVH
jgi:glycosyltransferase involved in cell wall biosynthesis